MDTSKEEKLRLRQVQIYKFKNLLDTPIFTIPWSARTINCLNRAKIKTIGDFKKYTLKTTYHWPPDSLLAFRNFGKKSLEEIKNKLSDYFFSIIFKEK